MKKNYITPKTKSVKVIPSCMLSGSPMQINYNESVDVDATKDMYDLEDDAPIGIAW